MYLQLLIPMLLGLFFTRNKTNGNFFFSSPSIHPSIHPPIYATQCTQHNLIHQRHGKKKNTIPPPHTHTLSTPGLVLPIHPLISQGRYPALTTQHFHSSVHLIDKERLESVLQFSNSVHVSSFSSSVFPLQKEKLNFKVMLPLLLFPYHKEFSCFLFLYFFFFRLFSLFGREINRNGKV